MMERREQKEQKKKEYMYKYPLVDVTYGMLISHAKEDLKEVKEQSTGCSLVFDMYIPWLDIEIKRLKREIKEEIYKDLVDDEKLSSLVDEMERLLLEYNVEKERLKVQSIKLSPCEEKCALKK